MELRHLYILSEVIRKKIDEKDLPESAVDNMEIKITLDPVTFYGVDKEFYYMTHGNTYEGFAHSDIVNATINGVKFNIVSRFNEERNKKIEII